MLDIKTLKLLTSSKLQFSDLGYHASLYITVFLMFASMMVFLMEFLACIFTCICDGYKVCIMWCVQSCFPFVTFKLVGHLL